MAVVVQCDLPRPEDNLTSQPKLLCIAKMKGLETGGAEVGMQSSLTHGVYKDMLQLYPMMTGHTCRWTSAAQLDKLSGTETRAPHTSSTESPSFPMRRWPRHRQKGTHELWP